MENEELILEEKPPKSRKLSTILMGIFLFIMFVITMILLPLDLKKTLKEIQESSSGDGGSAIGGAFASFIVALLIILIHGAFVIFIVGCGIMLIFLIKNIKHANIKAIKIINIVELSIAGVIIAISLIKLILLFVK